MGKYLCKNMFHHFKQTFKFSKVGSSKQWYSYCCFHINAAASIFYFIPKFKNSKFDRGSGRMLIFDRPKIKINISTATAVGFRILNFASYHF